jgi:hypothetical protein
MGMSSNGSLQFAVTRRSAKIKPSATQLGEPQPAAKQLQLVEAKAFPEAARNVEGPLTEVTSGSGDF